LYHQGDVGEASYAAVPMLARIARTSSRTDGMLYGLINAIEAGRMTTAPSKNPPLPDWLSSDYELAIRAMMAFALEDLPCVEEPAVVNQLLATIAFAKQSIGAGIVLTEMDDAQLAEIAAGRFES
jgi:hypothetical protein